MEPSKYNTNFFLMSVMKIHLGIWNRHFLWHFLIRHWSSTNKVTCVCDGHANLRMVRKTKMLLKKNHIQVLKRVFDEMHGKIMFQNFYWHILFLQYVGQCFSLLMIYRHSSPAEDGRKITDLESCLSLPSYIISTWWMPRFKTNYSLKHSLSLLDGCSCFFAKYT